jgi:hypothetical protein
MIVFFMMRLAFGGLTFPARAQNRAHAAKNVAMGVATTAWKVGL